MKKRAISVLLTLVLLVGILPMSVLKARAGGWLEDYTWDEESATLTIHSMDDPYGYLSGSDAKWYAEQIPWHVYCEQAKCVIIDDGVEKILPYTFLSFTQLKTVIIEDGATEIGYSAFAHCSNLVDVSIPESITSICDSSFFCCESLSSIVISEYVTNIETAFGGCTNLTELVVDENNPNYTFHSGALFSKDGTVLLQCLASNSGEYAIPDGVQTIGDGAFRTCDDLTAVSFPDSVTAIEARAFYECENITKVILPESISEVGLYAFRLCPALCEVWIHNPQCSLGEEAFSVYAYIYGYVGSTAEAYCDTYGNMFIDIQNPTQNPTSPFSGMCGENAVWKYDAATRTLTISGTGAMHDYSGVMNLPPWIISELLEDGNGFSFGPKYTIENVVIEEGITTIGNCAFYGCFDLKNIVIPDGVTSIGDEAFYSCHNLESVTIPGSVTSIADSAFSSCEGLKAFIVSEENSAYTSDTFGVLYNKNLTTLIQCPRYVSGSYTIPDSVTTIGECAFYFCSSLSEVIIPEGLERIESQAFAYCENLSDLSIPRSVKHIGDYAFFQTGLYMDETNWVDGAFYIDDWLLEIEDDSLMTEIPVGTCGLGEYAFAFSDITGVSIPETVEYISDSAFYGCDSLTEIFIPESVTYIGVGAFSGCSSLAGIWVDENNPNYSSNESGVLFDKEKTRLMQAPGILPGTYYVPDGVETMDDYAFRYCAGLSNIHIPSSTALIAENAIAACWDLEGIWVDANNADYSSDSAGVLFNKGKSKLLLAPRMLQGDYAIPNSVTVLNDGAFQGCSQLTSIIIPDGVSCIGTYVFSGCSSLTSIMLPDSVKSIGDSAFNNCSSLTSIMLPDSVKSIGDYAFVSCNSLESITLPESVTSIGHQAFAWCSSLKSVYFMGEAPEIRTHVFNIKNSETGEYEPIPGLTLYYIEGAAGWTTPTWNGYPTATWESSDLTEVDIKISHTVSFDSDLKMNYRIKYENIASAIPNYVTEGAYLVVEKDQYLASGEFKVDTVTLYPDLQSDSTRMLFNLGGIQSVEMGSELRAVLHIFDAEGNEYVTPVDAYSVLDYAQLFYDTYTYEQQPELYAMLIDALNYGSAAQIYFGRRADVLVNAGMEAYQQYATTELSAALEDSKVTETNDRSITAVSKIGFSVTFADKTEMNAKLTIASGYSKSDITSVKVLNAAGEVVDTLTDFTELSDGRLQVTYYGVKSVQMRDRFYFVAYVGDQVASDNVGYSVEAYAKSNIASADANLADMVLKCIYYGDSAFAYFNR